MMWPHVQTGAQLCKTVTHGDAKHFGVEQKCIMCIIYNIGVGYIPSVVGHG